MIQLDRILVNRNGRPKGLVPYRPRGGTVLDAEAILVLYEQMREADALPIGPRTVGYRLKEMFVGEYTKADFPRLNTIVTRLQQAGKIPWSWVADAASVTYEADGWDTPDEYIAQAHEDYCRDRRTGQPLVVETVGEARETLPLIRRLGVERGVTVYSGGGSSGPGLARKVAFRALRRAVDHGQSTLILGICDFDKPGMVNVLRPHVEHVAAFLYGTSRGTKILAYRPEGDEPVTMRETDASVSFRHLALTPEHAVDLVETADDREAIRRYVASGSDLWTRDADLLDGVQKIETEALDPVVLRDLFITAIDDVLDVDQLERVADEETAERDLIEAAFGEITLNGNGDGS